MPEYQVVVLHNALWLTLISCRITSVSNSQKQTNDSGGQMRGEETVSLVDVVEVMKVMKNMVLP